MLIYSHKLYHIASYVAACDMYIDACNFLCALFS